MLEKIASLQIRAVADRALAAREARDRILSGVRDAAFGEQRPARGAHNPAAALGLDTLSETEPHRKALEAALSAFPAPARRELWALVLVGRGEYALKDWERAMSDVNRLPDIGVGMFMEQADLHECLMKAVYELERI